MYSPVGLKSSLSSPALQEGDKNTSNNSKHISLIGKVKGFFGVSPSSSTKVSLKQKKIEKYFNSKSAYPHLMNNFDSLGDRGQFIRTIAESLVYQIINVRLPENLVSIKERRKAESEIKLAKFILLNKMPTKYLDNIQEGEIKGAATRIYNIIKDKEAYKGRYTFSEEEIQNIFSRYFEEVAIERSN